MSFLLLLALSLCLRVSPSDPLTIKEDVIHNQHTWHSCINELNQRPKAVLYGCNGSSLDALIQKTEVTLKQSVAHA